MNLVALIGSSSISGFGCGAYLELWGWALLSPVGASQPRIFHDLSSNTDDPHDFTEVSLLYKTNLFDPAGSLPVQI